jgi:hypothetical protein
MPNRGPLGQIDAYARRRMREYGDLYGWSIISLAGKESVLFVVALNAEVASFPSSIGGMTVLLKPVPSPEPQKTLRS